MIYRIGDSTFDMLETVVLDPVQRLARVGPLRFSRRMVCGARAPRRAGVRFGRTSGSACRAARGRARRPL